MKFLPVLLLVFCSFANTEPKHIIKGCNDFKSGTFEIVDAKLDRRYVIERRGNWQSEETFTIAGERIRGKMYFKIQWINDCEYNLFCDTSKSTFDEEDLKINANGGVNIKILTMNKNCATFRCKVMDFSMEGEVCKIQ
ncbi:hypothetical protein [Flavobacterium orientale]|uniref:Uncharacterized protein n=1 Tax=Flavobacterium orientale TaxID=1756020 RepID=A0A917DE88_9FLAO|nr:hypothetical protein [Flavobacterium orientale]GGD30779.1 hypothetical protein GCM10011343_21170 [Flavobacterium orientale]